MPASRYLEGNFAPVTEEVTAFDLPVEGEIPESLHGLFVRNGPNPAVPPEGSYHWFVGDGMVHGVALEGGRALWYRNRWLRTEAYAAATGQAAPAAPPDITIADIELSPGNTNVVAHGGMLMAMCEVSLPIKLTDELETIGRHDYGGTVQRIAFNAHPKIDPVNGEMHIVGYDVVRQPYVRYHVIGADGTYLRGIDIDTPGPTMMHDIALTAEHLVLFDLPVLFDLDLITTGRRMPFRWSPDYGTRIGLLRRDDPTGAVRWFDIENCYVFHTLNAYDDGEGRVVVDGIRYDHTFKVEEDGPDDGVGNVLRRWTVDPVAGVVKEETIDERTAEFPRVNPRRVGRPYRYAYAVGLGSVFGGHELEHLYKYDLHSGAVVEHRLPAGRQAGEGVFVPAGAGGAEDEGWVLAYVYDGERNGTDLVILDAADFAAPPRAVVHLPTRVPHGFHGSWVGAEAVS